MSQKNKQELLFYFRLTSAVNVLYIYVVCDHFSSFRLTPFLVQLSKSLLQLHEGPVQFSRHLH